MRHVRVKIKTHKKLEKNQADQFLMFRYVAERSSAWSFL